MRQVAIRQEVILQAHASGALLREACAFNETLQAAFPYGKMLVVQKGVYHFKTHQEANDHQAQILTDTIVAIHNMKGLTT
ncbi:MAG: hypothetical protein ABL915_08825 [Gallionella sp.]